MVDCAHTVPPPNREVCDNRSLTISWNVLDGHLSSFMVQSVPTVPAKEKPLQVFKKIYKKVNILHC